MPPTKEDLKKSILILEPDNKTVNMIRVSVTQLNVELREAQRRSKARIDAMKADDAAADCTVRFRKEDHGYSWRLEAEDFLGELAYGQDLPPVGSRAVNDDNEILMVIEALPGLAIRGCDLTAREIFDPRRIYTLKNGDIEIVFKRQGPDGKSIVWSFKQNMEIAIGNGVELVRTDKQATATAAGVQRMSQKNLAAWIIANQPGITGQELTAALRAAFPLARVDTRHGPHYISLSRTGKLPEATETDPRTWSPNK